MQHAVVDGAEAAQVGLPVWTSPLETPSIALERLVAAKAVAVTALDVGHAFR
jgi:hypothetical protein